MDWIQIISLLGGLELIKWLWSTLANRRNDARLSDSQADAAQFHVLQELIQFLQTQLADKEQRFADQTRLVRQLNRDALDLEREKARLEVELAKVRCDDLQCPFRRPPNAFTAPAPGVSKEEFFTTDKTTITTNVQ